jgi:hypothetical protein
MAYQFEPTAEKVQGIISGQILLSSEATEQYCVSTGDEPNEPMTTAATFGTPCELRYDYSLMAVANDQDVADLIQVTIGGFQNLLDRLEFLDLYQEWQNSRSSISSIVGDITRNQFYFRIVGMGRRALPSIFMFLSEEVKAGEPDHWFPALEAITGANPVPAGKEGRIRDMAAAWLEWGRREGYLNVEAMGEEAAEPGNLDL